MWRVFASRMAGAVGGHAAVARLRHGEGGGGGGKQNDAPVRR